jgi:hypothetical protein
MKRLERNSMRRHWLVEAAFAASLMLCWIAPPATAQDAPVPAPAPAPENADAPPAAEAAVEGDSIDAAKAPQSFNAPLAWTRKVRLIENSKSVVRSGPGDRFAIVGVYGKGATFPVIAKSGDWFNVRLSESETGWIHSSLCKEFDDLSDLEFKPNPKLFSRTGSFVGGGYGGAYAFDRKSNSLVAGGRLGYYVFDRLQFEGGVAWTHIRRPAEIVETLFGLTLEEEDFHMVFYNLNVLLELLPGRQMVPFVTAGVGSSIMRGETETAFNFGGGTSLFISKRTAVRWEFRGYRFSSGPDAARVSNDNAEFTLGTVVLF